MPVRIIALALGLAGWVTYSMIWLGVRLFGSVTLTFGNWGPGWLEWLELWIEPLILIGWLAFLIWVLWREINVGDSEKSPKLSLSRILRILKRQSKTSRRRDENHT